MSTLTSPGVALTLETFRAQNDGCLAYLMVDEASRTALAIDPRLDQVDPVAPGADDAGRAPDPCA